MIHGIYHFGHKRVACRNDYCSVCQAPTFAEGRRSLVMLHLFFVPLIPLGLKTRWYCTNGGHETDAKRPSRRGFLIAGVLFGSLMTLVGVMVWLETNDATAGGTCLAMGLTCTGALLWLMKRENYRAYEAARRTVVPLNRDICPYCRNPVFPGTTPRCHSCKVTIVVA